MSAEDDDNKTEKPSDKRLRDAKADGNVPRSRDLATAAVTGATVVVLVSLGGPIAARAANWFTHALTLTPAMWQRDDQLFAQAMKVLWGGLLLGLPFMLACVVAGIVANVALGGFNLTAKGFIPNFGRLDPLKGFGRLVSMQSWVEVGKGLVKFALVGSVAFFALKRAAPELARLAMEGEGDGMLHGIAIVRGVMLLLLAPLVAIALFDVPWQWWNWMRKLRMSTEEVKREHKEAEGSPETKGRVRRVQHEMARRRMMEDVPRADVVLVNPTHYSVALKYDRAKMRAPQVVAKGVDEIAMIIREVAGKHDVPIVSAPPLARALYRNAEVGHEVPVKLYQAVALILIYVYQLRTWRRHGGRQPAMPTLHVNEEE